MDPLTPLIASLHNEGRLRIWSLVITAFGDLVQHRGGEISTARLNQLLGRVGVEPGALRTALSRLTRDGWVRRERDGRMSHYRLSAQGLERFAPATTRIYAPPRRAPVLNWSLEVRLKEAEPAEIVLLPAQDAGGPADVRLLGKLENLTDAYRASLLEEAHRAALDALAADLAALPLVESPLDAAAARLLLIHRWRRIVLRYRELPAELMPPDVPLSNPRSAVADAYARLSPLAEQWLDTAADGLLPMPAADHRLAHRFAEKQNA